MIKRLHQLQVELGGLDVAVAVVNTQSFAAAEDVRRHQLGGQRAIVLSDLRSDGSCDAGQFVAIKRYNIATARSARRLVGVDKCLQVLENAEFLQRLVGSENGNLAVKLREFRCTYSFVSVRTS